MTRWSALSTLAMLMRRDAFMVALSVPEELEFDAHESEPTTRHVLGLIGDGPVAYARWRLATVDGNNVALCDRLCVREAYRGRGVARAAMQHILIDILQVVKHSMISLAGLVVNVPVDMTFAQEKLTAVGFVPLQVGS